VRIVTLDVGSSSVRAVAFDDATEPEPGDAHLAFRGRDADELIDACLSVIAQVGEGDALALSCFWHSLVAVDERDRPLTPVLTWQDGGGEFVPVLDAEAYHRRTGCFLHPSFWPAKLVRLRAEGVRASRYLSFGDYLLLRLTGEVATTVSTASGTGLFDPGRLDWDDETLEAVGVEREQLPAVSDDPVAGVWPAIGDGACANVGAGCVTRRRAAVTIGTSAAVRVVFETATPQPRDGLFLYRVDGRRVCEGGALSDGGNLHDWLRGALAPFDEAGLADRPPAAHGLTVLPFLGGERALGWDAGRRGSIHGLTFATTPADLAQAALEAVCYRLAAVLEAIGEIDVVVASGGALLANAAWRQVLADVLGRPLEVPAVAETSARGAAVLALERLGSNVPPPATADVVEPRPEQHAIHVAARAEQERWMRTKEV
jgi:gluconokinase